MATGSSAKKVQTSVGATEPKKSKFNEALFDAAIQGILLSEQRMETPNTEVEKAAKEAFTTDSIGGKINLAETYGNAVDAIQAFETWLAESDWHYEPPVLYTGKLLTVCLTAQAASGQVSVSMQFEPSDWTDIAPAIAAAKRDLQNAFLDAFPHTKPTGKSASKPNKPKSDTSETETYEFDRLVIGSYQGKPTARLMPTEGRWTQFGVALYPKEAEKFGIELPEEEGEYDYTGTMTYTMSADDKPRKVTHIELDEQ